VRELLEYWRENPPMVDYLAIFDRAYIKRRRTAGAGGSDVPLQPWLAPGLSNEERERLAREAIRGIKAGAGDHGFLKG
jgi:hypothetical protein